MTAFKFRVKRGGAHIELLVYVGPDLDHLALSGRLMFSPEEYQAFVLRILGVSGLAEVDEWEAVAR